MASRKPSISRASKKLPKSGARRAPRTIRKVAHMTADGFANVNERLKYLEARLAQMVEIDTQNALAIRVDMLEKQKTPALVLDGLVAEAMKHVVGSLRGIEEAVAKIAERLLEAPPAAKERKPREPKAATPPAAEGVAIKNNPVVDQGTPVPAEPGTIPAEGQKRKVDRKTCPHDGARTRVEGNMKLERCNACGATLDRNLPAVEEKKPEEKAAPPPTFEELRERAVAYAQKHSKAKMLEMLVPFAGLPAADVKLSLIPDTKRAAAIAALEV